MAATRSLGTTINQAITVYLYLIQVVWANGT